MAIVDTQSVKNAETAHLKGYDGGKKVSGIKRHIAVYVRRHTEAMGGKVFSFVAGEMQETVEELRAIGHVKRWDGSTRVYQDFVEKNLDSF